MVKHFHEFHNMKAVSSNLNTYSSISTTKQHKQDGTAMIETNNLTRTFSNLTAVDNLTLNIEKGEVFGFLGPNGAGKTTTIRMLACLITPTKGTATVAGYDIHKEPLKVRQSVGILTENPSLYERLTAYENMDFFAQAYGITDTAEKTKEDSRSCWSFSTSGIAETIKSQDLARV